MKKLRILVSFVALVFLSVGGSPAFSQTSSKENSSPYEEATQRDSKNQFSSYGWIGLAGLAGLLGLRRNRNRGNTAMTTVVLITGVLATSALLLSVTPAISQTPRSEKGLDGDNTVKTSQRDTEDHETNFDWVGFFGLAGLVGLVGPKRNRVEGQRTSV
ncbi:WGxxGxxG family protein [Spirosoma radiotolerans]|uniref:Uncharacterized protein n=1 Tax=Spirosoma radiotolerans TaxID=1379870 RepID=A0A0E3V6R9_9BACT|nr:WGxxGxxG family protein [Spirosoma radiotolerans]AKD55262.1 hypothetical protein SD10_10475 [Spirosoma radiotolerans]